MSENKIVEKIRYCDKEGIFLWEEPMIFKRLWAPGRDWFIREGLGYNVLRVAIADKIQYVNIERAEQYDSQTVEA